MVKNHDLTIVADDLYNINLDSDFKTVLEALDRNAKTALGPVVPVLEGGCLVGSLSEGDLRRALIDEVDVNEARFVERVMNHHPVVVQLAPKGTQGQKWSKKSSYFTVDDDGVLVGAVVDRSQSKLRAELMEREVVVFGLGFVGLTLACHIARSGFKITGVDTNCSTISTLENRISPFFEIGLQDAIEATAKSATFVTSYSRTSNKPQVFIVCVGTALNETLRLNSDALVEVLETIGSQLRRYDLVILRSTLPLGSSQELCIPTLERSSGLKEGSGFFYAVCPERTVEGNALEELRDLPQLVGANNPISLETAVSFFEIFSSSVVRLKDVSTAELSKLVSNAWRDFTFGFANELAFLCESMNVDALDLVKAVNYDYARNRLPLPSPGVGGYCLTKDPIFYAQGITKYTGVRFADALSYRTRLANNRMEDAPIRAIEKFCRLESLEIGELSVLIVGIAFKGEPETDDLRFSTGVTVAKSLMQKCRQVSVCDYTVRQESIEANGMRWFDVHNEVDMNVSAIIVMNNHRGNRNLNFASWLGRDRNPRLFFDGWGQFSTNQKGFESTNVRYATLGYYG